jgi:hypothetical protein
MAPAKAQVFASEAACHWCGGYVDKTLPWRHLTRVCVVPEYPVERVQLRAWCHRPKKKHLLAKVTATWSGWVVDVHEQVASRSGIAAIWARYREPSGELYCTAFCVGCVSRFRDSGR